MGSLEEAIQRAVQLKRLGRLTEAEGIVRQLLTLQPHSPDALALLGRICHRQYRPVEAEAALRQALQLDPEHVGALNNLGNLLVSCGQKEQGENAFRRARDVNPSNVVVMLNLGNLLLDSGRLVEAISVYRAAIALKPDQVYVLINLGNALCLQGNLSEARIHLEKAVSLAPRNPSAVTNFLFALSYDPDVSAEDLFATYTDMVSRLTGPVRPQASHTNDKDPDRRLRIGYVSPDFFRHSCAYYIEPLLAHHDGQQVEVFCYHEDYLTDSFTERMKTLVPHWRTTQGKSDREVADRIRGDRIDILIDISGHTAHSRLTVFAQRPAPVQVTWPIGTAFTSGLACMDYVLTDRYHAPDGSERFFSETILRLDGTYQVFRPPSKCPETVRLPALSKGFVTFGCFSRPVRFNHKVIALWSRMLREVPSSMLLFNAKPFGEDETRHLLIDRFAQYDIDPDRLIFHVTRNQAETMKAYGLVDIALDPFPHNAGTTTCEALWMGVPVITLKDRPPLGRIGTCHLSHTGLPEFCAETPDDYVQKAVYWSRHLDELAQVRSSLRQKMAASPLRDEKRFAREVEAAYRQMWRTWCRAT